MYNYERFSAPYKRGDYYYFSRNTGLQAQSVLYQQDTIDSEPRVFLDPNTLEADGTAALSTHAFSKSGLLYGYAIAKSGSDWVTIYVMDNKGNKLEDVVEWAKFTNISFTHDDKGFYYGVSFFFFCFYCCLLLSWTKGWREKEEGTICGGCDGMDVKNMMRDRI